MPTSNGGSRPDGNGGYGPPPAGGPPRRSMAEIAREASRSMSRQLGNAIARTGRALRRDDSSTYTPQAGSQYDSARNASSRMPAPAPDPSSVAPLPVPHLTSPNGLTKKLTSTAYRRSRIRLLARKWRMGRIRANPVAYALSVAATIIVAVGVVFGGGAGGVYAYSYYAANVGKIQAVADLKLHANSTIYDRNGIPLYTVKGDDQYHTYVGLQQINQYVQDATIDTEDRTFYSNSGVDLYGTVRAALVDARAGGASQGASTITQQLVKLLVLQNSEKVLTRKLHEAILAYGVTAQYNKAQILEMYLNQIDYGYPNQGIEAAAANYFGLGQKNNPDKTVTTANQQLELWQAAMLAGVPNGPTIFKPNVYSCDKAPCPMEQWDNPFAGNPLTSSTPCGLPYVSNFYGSATEDYWYNTHGHEWLVYCRTKLILDHMVQYGSPQKGMIYTGTQESDALTKVRDALEKQTIRKGVNTAVNGVTTDNKAPHFVQYVIDTLRDQFGIDHLESAGLKIYTTLDLNLNQYMQHQLSYYINEPHADPWYPIGGCGGLDCPLKDYANAHNGAGIAIDQHTGDIMAMVGSVDYNDTSKQVDGQFNVATSPRSMGSATKPVVYATAFQMGWDPGIMLQDAPTCLPNKEGNQPDPYAQACNGYYAPHNFDANHFAGTFPIRRMLANSLNIPAVEAMNFVGDGPASSTAFLAMAQRMGITVGVPKRGLIRENMGPATVLGAQEFPLSELTGAYATLANQGVRVPPRSILEIENNTGNVLYQAPANPYSYQAISPQAAYMMTSILMDNQARAPDFKAYNPLHLDPEYPNLEIAAKTGTSSGVTGPPDITTLGYTPYLTVGIWMGNNNHEDMNEIIGIAGPGFVFHDVMKWAVEHYHWDPNAHFTVPSGIGRAYFNCNTGLA
ncbi:MAG: transglycosylase domain-containing protein, partial [Ktedonobacterales bacterium]